MSPEEADEYRGRLEEILQARELDWILLETHEAIRQGKTVPREVDVSEPGTRVISSGSEGLTRRPRRLRRPQRYLRTEPTDPIENLRNLLDAINRAILSTVRMQSEMLDHLGVNRIEFVSEDGGQRYVFSRIAVDAQNRFMGRLNDVIAQLRQLL